jgi:hypothetical protein
MKAQEFILETSLGTGYAKVEFEGVSVNALAKRLEDAGYVVDSGRAGMILLRFVNIKDIPHIRDAVYDANGGLDVDIKMLTADEADQYK